MKQSKEDKLKRIKQNKAAEKARKKDKLKRECKLNKFQLAQEQEWKRRGNIRRKKKDVGNKTRRMQRRAKKGLRKIA